MYIGGYAEQEYNFEAFLAFEEFLEVEVGDPVTVLPI